MPRGKEPTFELKQIIWDIAARVGTESLSAIQKQVDYEIDKRRKPGSKEAEIFEDTPDVRTIKRIITRDINEIHPDVLVSVLPRYIWHLREDYDALLESARQKGLLVPNGVQSKSIIEEESEGIRTVESLEQSEDEIEHDKMIFIESDNILNKNEMRKCISTLSPEATFDKPCYFKFIEFLNYFSIESNKYRMTEIRDLCDQFCDNLDSLYSIVKRKESLKKLGERLKPIELMSERRIKELYERIKLRDVPNLSTSAEPQSYSKTNDNEQESQNSHWELIDNERRTREFVKIFQEFKQIVWTCYLDYRNAVRNILSL